MKIQKRKEIKKMITYDNYLTITGKSDSITAYIDYLMDIESLSYDEAVEYIMQEHLYEMEDWNGNF